MKRSAFTMIELIFVIVVLGILAAVIVVKLSAVRTDAEATTAISDFNNGIRTVTGFAYAGNGLPVISDLVESTGGITTTADTMTATVRSTTCAEGRLYASGDFNITILSNTGDCEVFEGMADTNYKLKGRGIVR